RPVVVERTVVHDTLGTGNGARAATGCEEELLPRVFVAGVVRCAAPVEVERDNAPSEPQVGAGVLRTAPDLRLVGTRPKSFCKRRAGVRWMLFGADKDDRAVHVALSYSFDSSVARHAAADDQVADRFH